MVALAVDQVWGFFDLPRYTMSQSLGSASKRARNLPSTSRSMSTSSSSISTASSLPFAISRIVWRCEYQQATLAGGRRLYRGRFGREAAEMSFPEAQASGVGSD